jgi:2-polyprenyl-6-methoxyphenol hydroxylase-like FAD-dependent oxidoreductase
VTATIKEADGETTKIGAAYVAGCDGAGSTVREMRGIGFPDAPYEHVVFVAALLMSQKKMQKRVFPALSMIDIAYRQSPLSQNLDGGA